MRSYHQQAVPVHAARRLNHSHWMPPVQPRSSARAWSAPILKVCNPLVNGATTPKHFPPQDLVRFRILPPLDALPALPMLATIQWWVVPILTRGNAASRSRRSGTQADVPRYL